MNWRDLKTNPDNPRQISKEQFFALCESILKDREFLKYRQIIYNENGIILGGNQRYRAIQELVKRGELVDIPDEWFVCANDLSEEKQRVFVIKDNNPAGISGDWDEDTLANKWDDLPLEKWGIDTKGWDKEVEEDEVPELPEEPISKLGEVYQLGRHGLMCGDSTKIEDVEKLMNGNKADMVFTDPPYGADMGIMNDGDEFSQVFADFFSIIPCPDNIYICSDWRCIGDFYNSIQSNGKEIYNLIVWVKNLFGQGKLYHTKHEEIIFCGSGNYNKKELNNDENVWNADSVRNFGGSKNGKEAVGHPTQKPIEICARAIKNSSDKNQIVYDGFGGSGSTLIACEQLDRTCYMMELDPRYVDVIIKRWEKFTGNKAKSLKGGV